MHNHQIVNFNGLVEPSRWTPAAEAKRELSRNENSLSGTMEGGPATMERTTTTTVTFAQPFHLEGLDGTHPAGSYVVESHEERLSSLSFEGWRRTSTVIRLPATQPPRAAEQLVVVDPQALEAALAVDSATASR